MQTSTRWFDGATKHQSNREAVDQFNTNMSVDECLDYTTISEVDDELRLNRF
eukprot:m.992 g.992  ORF g.992 m.992 type:complete len:52 (-) comp502_c0_seq1:515-670(-)